MIQPRYKTEKWEQVVPKKTQHRLPYGILCIFLGSFSFAVAIAFCVLPIIVVCVPSETSISYLFWFCVFLLGIASGYAGFIAISKWFSLYEFRSEGLFKKTPFQKGILIPWENFQQISITQYPISGRGSYYIPTLLCFANHKAKKDIYGRWPDNLFNQNVIYIVYTDELYQGLCERCPYPIVDYRKSPYN